MLLSASCLQDPGYDRDDLDPYSVRRNPNLDLLGFYVEDRKYTQADFIQKFGAPSTEVDWFISKIDGDEVLLVCAKLLRVDGPSWEDVDGINVGIGSIWLCLPWGKVANKKEIPVEYSCNEVGVGKTVAIKNEDYSSFRYYKKRLPLESLVVAYDSITKDEINAAFTGEVYMDCIINPHTAIICKGKIHLNRNRDDYWTAAQAYEQWLKSYERQNYCYWPEPEASAY